MRSPFSYHLNEGTRGPVLSAPERESLVADVFHSYYASSYRKSYGLWRRWIKAYMENTGET
jgi:hypothetical protein